MTELIQLEIPEAVAIPPEGFVNVFYTEEDGLIVKKGKFHDVTVRTLVREYDPIDPDEPTSCFTIIAKETNTVVALNETGDVTGTDLYYSLNGGEWEAYAFGTSVTLESEGNFVRFWNKTNSFSRDLDKYLRFSIDRDVSFAGNIMSLLNFSNRCTEYCFFDMFYSCTNLTTAPALPATELADYCYSNMFRECGSLKYIKVHFTEWLKYATTDWVNKTTYTGTFVKPTALPDTKGTSNIPEGWTITSF